MKDEYVKDALLKQAKQKEAVLVECLPESFHIDDLRCIRLPNGVETYTHQHVPFLEMHPLEFSEPKYEDGKITVTVTQKYRKLK